MKLYNSPYFDYSDGLQIMIMDEPSGDGWEVYYRAPGYPFIFAFGLPKVHTFFDAIQVAKCNAERYAEVLFNE